MLGDYVTPIMRLEGTCTSYQAAGMVYPEEAIRLNETTLEMTLYLESHNSIYEPYPLIRMIALRGIA